MGLMHREVVKFSSQPKVEAKSNAPKLVPSV